MDNLQAGRVLLVGEGDFSFSLAFTRHLAKNDNVEITSSCLQSGEVFEKLHENGPTTVKLLKELGINLFFSVDATKLEENENITGKFDRIIFNFPHVGGKSNIKKNRQLLKDFFKSAVMVLAAGGDICVSFCRGQGGTPADDPVREWYNSWQGVTAAAYQHLVLSELWPFNAETYPEYSSTGFRSLDKGFYTGGGSLTYVFRICQRLPDPPSTLVLNPGTVHISGTSYTLQSPYVAEKFMRKLHTERGNPIYLVHQHILQALTAAVPVVNIDEPNPVISDSPSAHPKLVYSLSNNDDDSSKNMFLRRSMFDHLPDEQFTDTLKTNCLNCLVGSVCRVRSSVNSNDLPVNHELLLVLRKNNEDDQREQMWNTVSNALKEVIGSENNLIVNKFDDSSEGWMDSSVISPSSVHRLEVNYQSESLLTTESCNHNHETGPAEIPQKIKSKTIQALRHLAYLFETSDSIIALVNLESTAMVKYDIPDARLFWSQESAFQEQFSTVSATESFKYRPVSLYPPLWRHDLSIWESKSELPLQCEFDEQPLLDTIREVCGDLLRSVLLVNKWAEPKAGRITRCYRVIYQSYDRALSQKMAREVQLLVRSVVNDNTDVEVR